MPQNLRQNPAKSLKSYHLLLVVFFPVFGQRVLVSRTGPIYLRRDTLPDPDSYSHLQSYRSIIIPPSMCSLRLLARDSFQQILK
jgi:hypothetical protein